MSEREGTPEKFARMMRGQDPAPQGESEQDAEPSAGEEQVIDLFTRTPERQEAERSFIEGLHAPYVEGDDAA